jgi:hypothetical protein
MLAETPVVAQAVHALYNKNHAGWPRFGYSARVHLNRPANPVIL